MDFTAGSTKVCLDKDCELIDTHQLYLNIPAISTNSPLIKDDQPVLLWHRDGLDYRKRRSVSITLIEKQPALGEAHGIARKGIGLHHITYSRVTKGGRDR